DAKRPDGTTARYSSGFSCEKGTVESEKAMLGLAAERKKIAKQFPNLVDYESKRAFARFYEPQPIPPAGSPVEDVIVRRGFLGIRKGQTTRPFRRSGPEVAERLRRTAIGRPGVGKRESKGPYLRAYFCAQ